MNNKSENKVLSSPNRIVWAYFSALRRMCYQVEQDSSSEHKKEDAVLCVIAAVTGVEVFLNIYFRILIYEKPYKHAEERIQSDLKNRVPLDTKLKEWPEAVFGKKIDYGSGVGQKFLVLKNLRNGLVHFSSTWETIEIQGNIINGLADTSAFDSLGEYSAIQALETAEQFIAEIFILSGKQDVDIPWELRAWTGQPPRSMS